MRTYSRTYNRTARIANTRVTSRDGVARSPVFDDYQGTFAPLSMEDEDEPEDDEPPADDNEPEPTAECDTPKRKVRRR